MRVGFAYKTCMGMYNEMEFGVVLVAFLTMSGEGLETNGSLETSLVRCMGLLWGVSLSLWDVWGGNLRLGGLARLS